MRFAHGCVLLALVLGRFSAAGAQELGVQLQGGAISDPTGSVQLGMTISPELSWATSDRVGRVGISGTRLQSGMTVAGVAAAGDATVWQRGVAALVVSATARAAAAEPGYRSALLSLEPGVRIAGNGVAAQFSAALSAGGLSHGETGAGAGVLPIRHTGPGGGMLWRNGAGASASVGASQGAGSFSATVSWRRGSTGATWTDWSLGTQLEMGRLAAGLSAGLRTGLGAEGWGSLGASLPVSARLVATAAVGVQPADPLTGQAGGRFGLVGVRFSAGSTGRVSSPPVRPARVRPGGGELVLNAQQGSRVELIADWTGWQPVPLREVAPGEYRTTLPRQPGTYRFAVLVGGSWTVPPGFPTEPDEYGGRRAVLRVE